MKQFLRPVQTSVGSKSLMALTGLALITFVIAHMLGNLQIFLGRDALNSYAHHLKEIPLLLWSARTGLLLVFVLHIILGLRLAYANNRARPRRYVCENTFQASWAARHMVLTGLVLLAFVLYHLAHFTLGVVHEAAVTEDGKTVARNYLKLEEPFDPVTGRSLTGKPSPSYAEERQDVYEMVIAGFRTTWISLSYLAAMVFLWLHLWHGASSWLQSLGLNSRKAAGFVRWFGPVLATIVLVGNCSIPLAVWLRWIG
jgi:succinate dehydrogenase / fumarate reductase cytochrome b subunit